MDIKIQIWMGEEREEEEGEAREWREGVNLLGFSGIPFSMSIPCILK